MKLNLGKGFDRLGNLVEDAVSRDIGLSKSLSGCELSVGYGSDPGFGVPSYAAENAIFVGDEDLIGRKYSSPAAEALLSTNPEKVQLRAVYNGDSAKWDQKFAIAGDAEFDPIAGQLFSPWNITYLSRIWKKPLSYSRAKEMVRTERAGNNPFAEIFTLFLEDYAGWGVIGQTGSLQNNMTNDVNVRSGIMSFPIINIMGTYSVTLEEKRRGSWGAMGESPLARKQAYLNYVMDMIDSILIYYGNPETSTDGLLTISDIETWDSGSSMKELFESTTTQTRGSDAFRLIAKHINEFLESTDNKFDHIKIAISPAAYNALTSMPYSDVYDAEGAMRTFSKNYLAGKGPNGTTPQIEWISDPLLKANSIFNENDFDYMVISAPEIGAGPEDVKQPTNFYATALEKFVFPMIPGMYNEQYKTLRRVAGVIAPMPSAIKVYAGFGVQ